MGKRCLLAVVLMACATSLTASESARAGEFDVYSCRGAAGESIGISGWTAVGSAFGFIRNSCASGGSFAAGLGAGPAEEFASSRWVFDAPEHTTISRFVLYRSASSVAQAGYSKGYGLHLDSVDSDSAHLVEECYRWSGCASLGVLNGGITPWNYLSRRGLAARRLIASAHCLGVRQGCRSDWVGARFDIYQARLTLADSAAPALTHDPSGSLYSPGTVNGVRTVSVAGTDLGGGLYRVGVQVDGVTHGLQPLEASATCKRPATVPVPCPLEASGTYSFDTREFPDGTHTVRIALTDVAGNTTLSVPSTITIRNHPRPNGAGATRDVRLSARFKGRPGRYRMVRYGGRPTVVGHLKQASGAPVVGARMLIMGRAKRPGAHYKVLGLPRTDAGGHYALHLPKGPSRRLKVAYRAYDLDASVAAQRGLMVDVRAGVRLRIRPRHVTNGHRIVFRGRLLGGPGRRGTIVTMQETAPRPLTFMTLHADRHGRFHAGYRFRYTYRPSRFRFRALVQNQAGYPYARARSRALRVRVTP